VKTEKSKWILMFTALSIAVAAAVGVTLVAAERNHCEKVKADGTEQRMLAERAAADNELATEIRHTRQMLRIVDENASCFTQEELDRVEVARSVLNLMP
jgi:hypothetical protein